MKDTMKGFLKILLTLLVIAGVAYVAYAGIGESKNGSAEDITLGLDLAGGVSITYEANKENPTTEEMNDTIYKLQKRVENYSTEASVYQEGDNRVNVDIPGVSDADAILEALGKAGSIEFKDVNFKYSQKAGKYALSDVDIRIDEEKCNGCGACATACHEGAIGLVEGKAKLLHEHYCDGLGDCLPACPTNAITFEEREAPAYNEKAVLAAKQAGNDAMADVVSGMMQGEQARQDRFTQQLLNLDSQRTAQQIAAKRQSGDAWAQLGNNVFSSATQLGGVMLENNIPISELFKFKA